ncbi:MAG TPA: ATP-binding cassette domain-containing protein [Chitinophagales bacterium]|nr:ATP-binding cassette domain-containing protein [Chitinophagales bacterium]
MVFRLENLLPKPFEEIDVSASHVWNKSIGLSSGRYICLQAASGKGKSTLLHILYGRRKDYSGSAMLDGADIRSFSEGKWAALRQKKLSIVFQELMLFSELTGLENILLKSRLTNYYNQDRIFEMAKRLNVQHLFRKKCGILSFGEKQRIAILRALVQPFEWLLLDEPFSHLDSENSQRAAELILEECKGRHAGILVTALEHDNLFPYHEIITV